MRLEGKKLRGPCGPCLSDGFQIFQPLLVDYMNSLVGGFVNECYFRFWRYLLRLRWILVGQLEALFQQYVIIHDSLFKQLTLIKTNRAGMFI